MKLGLLCPTRKRPDELNRMLESIDDTISRDHEIEVALRIDDDDLETIDYIMEHKKDFSFFIRHFIDSRNKHLGKMWTMLWKKTEADIYQGLNDDAVFLTNEWDRKIAEEANAFDDNIAFLWGDNTFTEYPDHYFITDKATEVLGYFCWEESPEFYNDAWPYEVFKYVRNKLGEDRLVYLEDVKIKHIRPGWCDIEPDETFEEIRKAKNEFEPEKKFRLEENKERRREEAKKLYDYITSKTFKWAEEPDY